MEKAVKRALAQREEERQLMGLDGAGGGGAGTWGGLGGGMVGTATGNSVGMGSGTGAGAGMGMGKGEAYDAYAKFARLHVIEAFGKDKAQDQDKYGPGDGKKRGKKGGKDAANVSFLA